MLYYYRSWRRYSRPLSHFFYLFLLSFILTLIWINLNKDTGHYFEGQRAPSSVFCFVLSANDRHLTSSRAIIYSWGKLCDRFYFITRLQNTSIDLMMLEKFENISNIKSTTLNSQTMNILSYLQNEQLFSSYQWFLRATDDSYVIIPNLRKLVKQLENNSPLAYVGDVEKMYKNYQILSTGSVMLFNRNALKRLDTINSDDDDDQERNIDQECFEKMIYDHEFVLCMEKIDIRINPLHENLILSQNLSFYKMDERFKVKYK